MPKRIVDGSGVWRSVKLKQVQPVEFRAEFANLIPLATGNGTFECNPDLILHEVYGFNRPDMTIERVVSLLDEFERVKLLFRWVPDELPNQTWGYWVGIDKPGRLPPPSRTSHEKKGPAPPPDLLGEFLQSPLESVASQRVATGCIGLGLGMGLGIGLGVGVGAGSHPDQKQNQPPHSPTHTENEQDADKLQAKACEHHETTGNYKLRSAILSALDSGHRPQDVWQALRDTRIESIDRMPWKTLADNLPVALEILSQQREKEERTRRQLEQSTIHEQAKARAELEARETAEQAEAALIEETL